MNIEKYNLFAIPVCYYRGFLPPELARDIENYILHSRPSIHPHKALIGDAHTSHSIHNLFINEVVDKVGSCAELKNNITKCIDNYVQETGRQACEITNSWFNIQNPGSTLHRHNHVGGNTVISGALYINIEENSSPLVFENPNPYSLLTEHAGKYDYTYYTFKPAIGDLILFPSWLVHSSVEPNTTFNRIVVSFNVRQI